MDIQKRISDIRKCILDIRIYCTLLSDIQNRNLDIQNNLRRYLETLFWISKISCVFWISEIEHLLRAIMDIRNNYF